MDYVFVPVCIEVNPFEGLYKGISSRRQNKYKESSWVTWGLVMQRVEHSVLNAG